MTLTLPSKRLLDVKWKVRIPSRILIAYASKGLTVPDGGWSARTFGRNGKQLIKVLVRLAKITQRKAVPHVAKIAKSIFTRQTQAVIDRVTGNYLRPGYGIRSATLLDRVTIDHEQIWLEAIEEVFGSAALESTLEFVPTLRSVMDQGFSKTQSMMGVKVHRGDPAIIARRVQGIAERVVGVSATTKKRLASVIRRSIDDGLTVSETATELLSVSAKINEARAMCIARTELSNAYTQGAIEAYKQSPTLTHVSVIGCEARESNGPLYRGEPTCNIEDVPVSESDQLEWHPNHTGCLIPSKFKDE